MARLLAFTCNRNSCHSRLTSADVILFSVAYTWSYFCQFFSLKIHFLAIPAWRKCNFVPVERQIVCAKIFVHKKTIRNVVSEFRLKTHFEKEKTFIRFAYHLSSSPNVASRYQQPILLSFRTEIWVNVLLRPRWFFELRICRTLGERKPSRCYSQNHVVICGRRGSAYQRHRECAGMIGEEHLPDPKVDELGPDDALNDGQPVGTEGNPM